MKYLKKVLPRTRSRTSKKILGFLIIFGLSGLAMQGQVGTAEVHALTQTEARTDVTSIDKLGFLQIIDMVLKVIYILLRPLLVVAGWALDNTLVYGSVFHLDVPLWKFWNMLKNFANFTLGFLVLFAILKSIFTNAGLGSLKEGKSPLGIIKKTLIAGILIQASRFLFAAVIDISTVATYAVGGLPLSVLKNTDLGKQKILAVNSEIDINKISNLTDQGKSISVTYSAGPHKLSSCVLSNNMGQNDAGYRYIVARKVSSGTDMGKCVYGGTMVIFFNETGLQNYFTNQNDYYHFIENKRSVANIDTLIANGYVVDIYNSGSFLAAKNSGAVWFASTPAMMLSELVSKSKGFVGPLVTIYSSLLNFAEISDTGVESYGKVSGELIIRMGFAIMLFFPLLALAVLLIVRIGYLWVVIATSPFIVLAESFSDTLKLPDSIKNYFSVTKILSVIFAPVVTVFALSIAVIFITTLINTFTPKTTASSAGQVDTTLANAFGDEIQQLPSNEGSQKYLIGGRQIEMINFNRGGTLDWFSRLVVNLISVGLMRALVFAALKANALGKSVVQPIQNFGSKFMSTLPILTVPGTGEKIGIGSALSVAAETPRRYTDYKTSKQEAVGIKLAESAINGNNTNKLSNEQISAIVSRDITNKDKATKAFEEQGISAENISTTVNNNTDALWNAIKDLPNRDEVGKAIGEAAEDNDWYKNMLTNKFKKILGLTETTDQGTIIQKLNEEKNNALVSSYFEMQKTYEDKIGKTIFTINKTTGAFKEENITITKTT